MSTNNRVLEGISDCRNAELAIWYSKEYENSLFDTKESFVLSNMPKLKLKISYDIDSKSKIISRTLYTYCLIVCE